MRHLVQVDLHLCAAAAAPLPPSGAGADAAAASPPAAGYPNKQLEGKHPDWASMLKQVRVSAGAIPLYALLPPLSEHMILSGWTRCYGRIGTVGLPAYLGHFALYLARARAAPRAAAAAPPRIAADAAPGLRRRS